MRVHVDCVGAPFRSDDTRPRPNPNLKPFYGWNASKALGNIRDLVSMVIGFLVLTLLEQPEKLSKIKKASFLEHPVTMCITVLYLERVYDVRWALCGRAKRSTTTQHARRVLSSKCKRIMLKSN